MAGILDRVQDPSDLKKMQKEELDQLSAEIRDFLIEVVSANGGHLSSSLGAVELAVALHHVFSSPRDKIIWDVGHQSYAHKVLTGRKKVFDTLRMQGGISGFPHREESEHDVYGTGHSSTSISAALGLAEARELKGEDCHVIAVIGDGALTGGMAFEALNHAGALKRDMIVILNDNNMSIDHNVGSISSYLGRIRTSPGYTRLKEKITLFLHHVPLIGPLIAGATSRLKSALKQLLIPGMLFEELGFTYLGPVDGHDIKKLIAILQRAARKKGPVLIHALTQKGKGYIHAEKNPAEFHGVGPFDVSRGLSSPVLQRAPTYTEVFGRTLLELAEKDERLVAITAAMTAGTGLESFAARFPERFYDVGIAEAHAITLAAGLAVGGMKPVAAIYSTFMQRAYDQVIHELGVQKIPVVLALDRAGIVGRDGETHQGVFDLSYLRHIPNLSIMAPKDENELCHMLKTAFDHEEGPVAIRYPRSAGEGVSPENPRQLPWGRAELLRPGNDLLLLALGSMAWPARRAAERLAAEGVDVAVINARFAKPLDEDLILDLSRKCRGVMTVEENVLAGGFGSACLELLEENKLPVPVKRLGIGDEFVAHGSREELLALHRLDEKGIYEEAVSFAAHIRGEESPVAGSRFMK